MKVFICLLALLGFFPFAYAQDNTSPWPSTGNVGIGTTSPVNKLDVIGAVSATSGYKIANAAVSGSYLRGNGTAFTSSPIIAADVPVLNQNTTGAAYALSSRDTRNVSDLPSDFNSSIKFDFKYNSVNGLSDGGSFNGVMTWRKYGNSTDFTGGGVMQLGYGENGNLWTRNSASVSTWNSWLQLLNSKTGVMLSPALSGTPQAGNLNLDGSGAFSGSLMIGTIDPKNFKLAVNGSAIATSVTVKIKNEWPDYVFDRQYKLTPLSDLEKYINDNKHLPEVPSQSDVTGEGLNLGEMNRILLKKVEELTLYLIEQNKRIGEQQKTIDFLRKTAVTNQSTISANKMQSNDTANAHEHIGE